MVRKTSVVPLPAATCEELSEHVLTAGQPVNVRTTGFGNVPKEGVTVMSYFAEAPTAIVAGPELLIVKLNALLCTVRAMVVFAVSEPDVPITVIVYAPGGVPDAPAVVVTARKTSVVPLPAATCAELSEQVVCGGHPVNERTTALGNVPEEGVIVMSYFPEDPTAIVAGPELESEKLNAIACTANAITVLAVCEPDVPVTVIE